MCASLLAMTVYQVTRFKSLSLVSFKHSNQAEHRSARNIPPTQLKPPIATRFRAKSGAADAPTMPPRLEAADAPDRFDYRKATIDQTRGY